MNPSTALARGVLRRLLAAEVRDLVLSPGSRNAPLSFAAYDAAQAGLLRLHTRIDERTAGYLALGLAKTGPPAAVVCTSGTAVANLHPALLEAAHAGVPLVAVTADRPARLRGTSANQTADQLGIFGPHIPTVDLALPADPADLADPAELAELVGPLTLRRPPFGGPIHLNVQFDDPLLPAESALDDRRVGASSPPSRRLMTAESAWTRRPHSRSLPLGPRTVVVAGDDSGPPARILAESADWPLLAEPSSGSRTGTHAIRTYRLLLDGELGERVERVVVFGHPTLSRPVSRLLSRPDVEVWAAEGHGSWPARPFPVAHTFTPRDLGVDRADERAWFEEWLAADAQTGRGLDELLRGEPELTPYEVAGAVARALPAGGLLQVGASSPIRDLDLMVPRYRVGDRRKVIANRGLAGIDGTVSTAIGAALGRPESTRALALMGDVTFLHDLTGLVIGPREARPDLTIVVVNDDGGSIFAVLEQGAPAYDDRYDALFGLPHGADLASLCAGLRVPHWRVDSLPELDHALASPHGGIEVVEAVVRRDNRRGLDERIRALV